MLSVVIYSVHFLLPVYCMLILPLWFLKDLPGHLLEAALYIQLCSFKGKWDLINQMKEERQNSRGCGEDAALAIMLVMPRSTKEWGCTMVFIILLQLNIKKCLWIHRGLAYFFMSVFKGYFITEGSEVLYKEGAPIIHIFSKSHNPCCCWDAASHKLSF